MQAVELIPQAARRTLDPARRERLLTLPRSQRFDPPTHIVRLVDGDYLRGHVVGLDDTHVVITVAPGDEKRIPRRAVARVIWLHPEELAGGQPQGGGRRGAGTTAQGVAENGTRITLAVDDMQEGRIRGRIAAIGPGVIDVATTDRVLLGAAIDGEAVSLPYRQWKLKPAAEPRAVRGRRDDGPEVARQRQPLSGLAGKPAARVSPARVDAGAAILGRVPLAAAPGRILVLEFWSEWSLPSRDTLPAIVATAKAQPAGCVDVVAVSVGDSPAKAAAALGPLGLESTVIDPERAVADAFEVREVPARAVIGPDGVVIDVLRGGGPEAVEAFRTLLAAAVAESGPLRKELAALNQVRALAERGDRECLERIAPLLSSTHGLVRRQSVALLRRLAPLALPAAVPGPGPLTADVRLDREAAAWKRWIAREGSVASLRPVPAAGGDRERPPAPELGRLLVCMTGINQVGEFSPDGRLFWTHQFPKPGACAGLPNGHRLVGSAATPGRVVEFDADGKEAWSILDLPAGVTSVARLADGNTLVGFDAQRVAEYDRDGRMVWEAAVLGRPCAAFRLEGGTTLVACQESDRIAEIDRDGSELSAIEDLDGLKGAVRIADGHLVVAMTDRVVELDATGTIVSAREGLNAAVAADRRADGATLVLNAQDGAIVELDAAGLERGRKQFRGGRVATRLDAY